MDNAKLEPHTKEETREALSSPSLRDQIYRWCDESVDLYERHKDMLLLNQDDVTYMHVTSKLEIWKQERER